MAYTEATARPVFVGHSSLTETTLQSDEDLYQGDPDAGYTCHSLVLRLSRRTAVGAHVMWLCFCGAAGLAVTGFVFAIIALRSMHVALYSAAEEGGVTQAELRASIYAMPSGVVAITLWMAHLNVNYMLACAITGIATLACQQILFALMLTIPALTYRELITSSVAHAFSAVSVTAATCFAAICWSGGFSLAGISPEAYRRIIETHGTRVSPDYDTLLRLASASSLSGCIFLAVLPILAHLSLSDRLLSPVAGGVHAKGDDKHDPAASEHAVTPFSINPSDTSPPRYTSHVPY
jgi:hypothetical protein